jgi:hypothetical protein
VRAAVAGHGVGDRYQPGYGRERWLHEAMVNVETVDIYKKIMIDYKYENTISCK